MGLTNSAFHLKIFKMIGLIVFFSDSMIVCSLSAIETWNWNIIYVGQCPCPSQQRGNIGHWKIMVSSETWALVIICCKVEYKYLITLWLDHGVNVESSTAVLSAPGSVLCGEGELLVPHSIRVGVGGKQVIWHTHSCQVWIKYIQLDFIELVSLIFS